MNDTSSELLSIFISIAVLRTDAVFDVADLKNLISFSISSESVASDFCPFFFLKKNDELFISIIFGILYVKMRKYLFV